MPEAVTAAKVVASISSGSSFPTPCEARSATLAAVTPTPSEDDPAAAIEILPPVCSDTASDGYQCVGVKCIYLRNFWFNGKWTTKWRSAYEYRNVQTKVDYFNEWWT